MMTERSAGQHYVEIKNEEEYVMKEGNVSNIGSSDEKAIVSSIEGKLCRKSPLTAMQCIFKVPDILRRDNEKIFEPQLISIGPIHHGKNELQAMEKIKLWYLHCLLNQAPTSETSLEGFVKAIGSIEQSCRECYAEEICFSYNKKTFVEMMVVDGCFIIGFFCKAAQVVVPRDKDDPVFNTSWMFQQIATELLLLENQLPWCVLNRLFEMTYGKKTAISLSSIVAFSFDKLVQSKDVYRNYNDRVNKHLLDFLRNYLLGSSYAYKESRLVTSWLDNIPSVSKLLLAGVRFQKKEKTDGILNITFNKGVMEIPELFVWEKTETLFKNLVAFEQCDKNSNSKVTSYIVFLDNLINNTKDVDFLVDQKILRIINCLNIEDIANFFNRLAVNAKINHSLYMDLYDQVTKHYESRWNRWRAILMRDYFSNPWSIVSFIAAFIILVLTIIQTIYSMLSYY